MVSATFLLYFYNALTFAPYKEYINAMIAQELLVSKTFTVKNIYRFSRQITSTFQDQLVYLHGYMKTVSIFFNSEEPFYTSILITLNLFLWKHCHRFHLLTFTVQTVPLWCTAAFESADFYFI